MSEQFVVSGDRSIGVGELNLRAAKLAAGLQSMGLRPGDRYAIVMRNEPGFLEASLAGSIIGAVPVPVNWHWTGSDLAHLLADCGASVVIAHSDLVAGVEAQMPDGMQVVEAPVPSEVAAAYGIRSDATSRHRTTEELIAQHDPPAPTSVAPPLAVIYTSGTTGRAKGIMRDPVDPSNALGLFEAMRDLMNYEPGGVTLIPAPLYHTAPNVAATFAIVAGLSVVLMPTFDPEEFLRLIELHEVTTVQVVPTMFVRLLRLSEEVRGRYDLSSLRQVVHAAAPCPQHVKLEMIDWLGPIVSEYYGGSEGGPWTYCTAEQWLEHRGSVGTAFRSAAIRILDVDKNEVAVGETGTIYGRPMAEWPSFTYLGDDDKRRGIDAGDGFITVGDVGHLDAEGFLYLSDRLNDMVISGGVNIYPAEIEATLLEMPEVADVAVFGIPESDLGEALAAHIELVPGAVLTEDAVKEHVRTRLARYKAPKVVVFEAALPREDSGKLFKRHLKERYREAGPLAPGDQGPSGSSAMT